LVYQQTANAAGTPDLASVYLYLIHLEKRNNGRDAFISLNVPEGVIEGLYDAYKSSFQSIRLNIQHNQILIIPFYEGLMEFCPHALSDDGIASRRLPLLQ
jgi:hypothetical protein